MIVQSQTTKHRTTVKLNEFDELDIKGAADRIISRMFPGYTFAKSDFFTSRKYHDQDFFDGDEFLVYPARSLGDMTEVLNNKGVYLEFTETGKTRSDNN